MNIYEEILGLDVDAEFAKSDLNDEPRAELRAQNPVRKGEENIDSPMAEKAIDPGSDNDAHHGGSQLGGDENDPTMGKAMGSLEMSEPGKSAINGADTLRANSFQVPNDIPWNGSANGVSGDAPGATVILSDDDVDVGQQMSGKERPLEQTLSVGHGNEARGENAVHGEDLGKGGEAFDYGRRALAAARAGLRVGEDVRLNSTAPAQRAQPAAAPQGRSWQQGFVSYSTSEDERISKALEEGNGSILGEPTLNWQAPLVQTHACGLCKSSFPAFLTVCPNCRCGASHTPGGVSLEKSVKDAVRGPQTRDVRFPSSGIVIE